jgi:UDP-GlcNAc:undecaprenyl-phosphate/decaprenyl-phosphate GlcNAc-1-phosphate transferase
MDDFEDMEGMLLSVLMAFSLSLVLTFLTRSLARKYGLVAKPRADRWHKKPTAMYGGVPIFITVWLVYFFFVEWSREITIILVGSSFLFLVGLIDDIFNIKPYQKLLGQIFGALFIIGNGLFLNWTESALINSAITLFWIIGITNAINLLDNMDGLAAGIAAIAAVVMVMSLYEAGGHSDALIISGFIGALLGFLVFNFNPASIFMGDSGSMFIGFFISTSVLLSQTAGRSRSIASVLAVPVLTLFVPIFDTTFVTILRKLSGKKISQGGRDHTSHRLVALGLSERKAVFLLYGLAITAGILAIIVRNLEFTQSLALIATFTILLIMIGIHLAKVKVYEEQKEAQQQNDIFTFLVDLSYKRRIFEIFLDIFLISLSYYLANTLIFGSIENDEKKWESFLMILPVMIVLKLFAFLFFGVYRGIWRYTTLGDSITFAKAVAAGSVLCISALFFFRLEEISRTVVVLDALFLFVALTASRLSFKLLRQILPYQAKPNCRKVLIYGAGDGGEMLLREIYNNPKLNYLPVGFIDDDPMKQGKTINGLKIFGSNGILSQVCGESGVQEIIISCKQLKPENLCRLKDFCRETGIVLKKAELKIETVGFE